MSQSVAVLVPVGPLVCQLVALSVSRWSVGRCVRHHRASVAMGRSWWTGGSVVVGRPLVACGSVAVGRLIAVRQSLWVNRGGLIVVG